MNSKGSFLVKTLCLCTIGTAILFSLQTIANAQLIKSRNPFGTTNSSEPEKTEKKGDWEYRLFLTAKGTRSQGQHGELYYKGAKYLVEKPGTVIQTDLGPMRFVGNSSANLWDSTGWVHHNPGNQTTSQTRRLEDNLKR